MRDATVFLMYHEIEAPGRPLCQSEPGYVRYVVQEAEFRRQMTWLQQRSIRGISVEDALLADGSSAAVVITFDDGCASDLLVAAPLLKQLGFGATFYITLGFLGRPGYLVAAQVRELSDAGFDIGCHSISHPYLSDLSRPQLQHEIADAKTELEQIVGRPVHHFSCPGGRWSAPAAAIAKDAGYHSVASSRVAVNRAGTDPFNLARVAVMRDLPLGAFQNICRARGLWRLQLRDFTRQAAKQVLGNSAYDRLRARALERKARPPGI
jgi:peptidoglycan/xylan/chitin deacetylase (PgdA/CDA1 family)